MIEFNKTSSIIIYTNHSTVVLISKQTTLNITNIDKLNLRFVRASQYFSFFNLEFRHKADKSNTVFDALFKLSKKDVVSNQFEKIFDVFYNHFINGFQLSESLMMYHIILVEMSNDFKKKLRNAYLNGSHWKKLLEMLKPLPKNPININEKKTQKFIINEIITNEIIIDGKRISSISFLVRDGLIYHISDDNKWHFCISIFMKQKLFEQTHNLFNHDDYHKCRDRFYHTVFIRHFVKNLRSYIVHCSEYQFNQIKKHKFYGSLISIVISAISFHILIMNLIVFFSTTVSGFNCFFIITYKFTKKVFLIPGKNIWKTSK